MANSLNESAWSTTPATNDGADSTIGSVNDNSSPNVVDNWVRSVMAARAKARLDQGGALVAGGTATALTVTTNQGLTGSAGQITNGLRLCVRAASAATGAATIAVDGLSAVAIKKNDGAAISAGDWSADSVLDLVYSSTATAFLVANIAGAASMNITGLTGETAPDHTADYIPFYDNSVAANRKVLPRYLAPSVRASFHAYKSGSSQVVSTTTSTKVTFATETFDVGSAFASSTWTPPAGTAIISACAIVTGYTAAERFTLWVFKNGTFYKRSGGTADSAGVVAASLSFIEQTTGSDTYDVYAESAADTSYSVLAGSDSTYFSGSMI